MKRLLSIIFIFTVSSFIMGLSAQLFYRSTTGIDAAILLHDNSISIGIPTGATTFQFSSRDNSSTLFGDYNNGILMSNDMSLFFLYVNGQSVVFTLTPPVNGYSGNSYSSGGSTTTYEEICSFCGGRGWRPGSSTPTYGLTGERWCDECGRSVSYSHSHDRCPSCNGRGYNTKVRY